MKNSNFKLFALLLIATIVGCAQETKKEATATDNAAAIETKHDTVYPQFPGGNEALDKHLILYNQHKYNHYHILQS